MAYQENTANFVGIRRLKYRQAQHSLFTIVNKKYRMKPRQRTLASFTAIIGLITLILAVSILAEKAHENHLPERNGRGTHEALIAYGLPAGILILLSAVFGFGKYLHRSRTTPGTISPGSGSYCSRRDALFPMEWPMRQPLRSMPLH
jgi:uncharacterized integral membrane protein